MVPKKMPAVIPSWYIKYSRTSRLLGDRYVNLAAAVSSMTRALTITTNALDAPWIGSHP